MKLGAREIAFLVVLAAVPVAAYTPTTRSRSDGGRARSYASGWSV